MKEISINVKKRIPLINSELVTIQIVGNKGIFAWKDKVGSYKVSFDSDSEGKLKVTVKTADFVAAMAKFKSRRLPVLIDVKDDKVILEQGENSETISKEKDESVTRVLSGNMIAHIDNLSSFRDYVSFVHKGSGSGAISISNNIVISKNGLYRLTDDQISIYQHPMNVDKVYLLTTSQIKLLNEFLKKCPSEEMQFIINEHSIMFKNADFELQTQVIESNLIPLDINVLTKEVEWKTLTEVDKGVLYESKDSQKDICSIIYLVTGEIKIAETNEAFFMKSSDEKVLKVLMKRRD